MSEQHETQADLFFRHVAEAGRFHEAQLYRFVELQGGAALSEFERRRLLEYALARGARREAKSIAPVYVLPTAMRISRRKVKSEDQLVFADLLGKARPHMRRQR